MMKADVLVADIGTGSAKVACFDRQGTIVARSIREYTGFDRYNDEIDPAVWYDAFVDTIRALRAEPGLALDALRTIVLSGQMQDLILVADGHAVAPAVLYFGHRKSAAYTTWLQRLGDERIRAVTCNTPDTAGFPAKLLAAYDSDPSVIDRSEYFLCGAHDYVAYRLTGVAATDPTTASTTGLFAPPTGEWSEEIAASLKRWTSHFPAVHVGGTVDGTILPHIAAELQLPETTRVVHGPGDVGASVLAMEQEGFSTSLYLGTSGWIQNVVAPNEPGDCSAGVFTLRHPTEERLIRVAPILTAAGAFEWFLSQVLNVGKDDHDALFERLATEAIDAANPASSILFLPYLAGERSPFNDPNAGGMFLGMRHETNRAALFRAIEEGVAFSVRSILEALAGGTRKRVMSPIQVTGGGVKIPGFPQLIADILGLEIDVPNNARFMGTGALRNLVSISPCTNSAGYQRIIPVDDTGYYARKYHLFREAFRKNQGLMAALRTISQGGRYATR